MDEASPVGTELKLFTPEPSFGDRPARANVAKGEESMILEVPSLVLDQTLVQLIHLQWKVSSRIPSRSDRLSMGEYNDVKLGTGTKQPRVPATPHGGKVGRRCSRRGS